MIAISPSHLACHLSKALFYLHSLTKIGRQRNISVMQHMCEQHFQAFISNKMNDRRSTVLLAIQAPANNRGWNCTSVSLLHPRYYLGGREEHIPLFYGAEGDNIDEWLTYFPLNGGDLYKIKQKTGAIITPVKLQSLQLCKNNPPALVLRMMKWAVHS